MLRNLKVLLSQTINAAGTQMDQTTCQRAFVESFLYESAGNIMAFGDHTHWLGKVIVC